MKLVGDGLEVGIDIRVVKFQVVDDQRLGTVEQELGALVEEGRVVLVGFDHENRICPQAGRELEVRRHTADQEACAPARALKDPCQQTGCGGLAVRTGYTNHRAVAQDCIRQPLRPGHVGNTPVQQFLDDRHTPSHDIANHDHVRRRIKLGCLIALDQLNAKTGQLVTHRRVDIAIRARYPVTGFPGDDGHTAHEGPADSKDMYVLHSKFARRGGQTGGGPNWANTR